MKTKTFDGSYTVGQVTRIVPSYDYGKDKEYNTTIVLNQINRGVVDAVIAFGEFSNTHEEFCTVRLQYQPGKTGFVTVSAQNLEPFLTKILKDNIEEPANPEEKKAGPSALKPWLLKEERMISAIGEAMAPRSRQIGSGQNSRYETVIERVPANEQSQGQTGPVRMLASEIYWIKPDGTYEVVVGAAPNKSAETTSTLASKVF